MKVRLKKIGSLFMVISMVTIMFYGCGRGDVKDTTISPVTTVTTESTAATSSATSSDTTVPPVSTTVDHVKEYDHQEYVRQLDNLKYGEVPEYLKQIGVPSEEDMEAIFAKTQIRNFITDPMQVWEEKFMVYGGTYWVYFGTFDLGNGESIMYFRDMFFPGYECWRIGDPDGIRNIAYYKQSGELVYRAHNIEELQRDLIVLRSTEYIYFVDFAYEIYSKEGTIK